ncbi:MAG: hypothetical protein Q4G64_07360, partial [bacterium]|nr:hypothetical protein [bacterium]
MLRDRARVSFHAVLAVTLVAFLVMVPITRVEAALIRSFSSYFSTQTNGAITITGNTLLTCPSSSGCTTALSSPTAAQGNNQFQMVLLDADSDPSTRSSSGATVNIPAGAQVLYAGLFWGAATAAGGGGQSAVAPPDVLKLRVPGAATYQSITASRIDRLASGNRDYSAYADITSIVRSAGAGMYWGADIAAATGTDRYGGWSIVVAYSHPDLPMRDLTVFGGYASLVSNERVATTVNGILTPLTGTVNSTFGFVVYEGDTQLTGDYFAVGGTRLADPLSPSNNFFAGRITSGGANLGDRVPASLNNMAVDAKTIHAPNVLANGATSAELTFSTSGDFYYPAALTSQIDLHSPSMAGAKSVVNLSGNSQARVGDVLEYTVAVSNVGLDAATDVVLRDTIPTGTTYLPDSLRISAGPGAGPITDGRDGDRGEAAGGVLTVRLGSGANGTVGGRMDPAESSTIRFRVQVTDAASGTTIVNGADVDFRAPTLSKDFTYQTNQVFTPVAPIADVSITKAGPAEVAAGSSITWLLTARNSGPNPAADVVVTDTLPPDLLDVAAADPRCAVEGATLTCSLGSLAPGVAVPISVTATVRADSLASSLTNVASVSTPTADPNPSNNSSASSTAVVRSADVSFTKVASAGSVIPGETLDFTFTATNEGPSVARSVVISDTVPDGWSVQGEPRVSAGSCSVAGADFRCEVGDLAPGASATVTVTGLLSSAWNATDPVINSASAQSQTPDPVPGNNRDSVTVTPTAPVADLAIVKRTVGEVRAGLPVTWELQVTNSGPSRAYGVEVRDPLPGVVTSASATSSQGTCQVAGSDVTCTLGDMAVGSSATIVVTGMLPPSAAGELANTATETSASTDPNPANDTASTSAEVLTRADLSIVKTATPAGGAWPPVAGDDVTYSFTVTNSGLSDAQDVVITDELPEGILNPRFPADTCTLTDRTLTCSLRTIGSGTSVPVEVTGTIDPTLGDDVQLVNAVTVASSTPDPDPDNNEATYTIPVIGMADVMVVKQAVTELAVAGERVEWLIQAENRGPAEAENVVVTDRLPPELRDVVVSSPGCSVASGTVTCELGTLAPGDTISISVSGVIDPGFTGSLLVNSASIATTTPEPTTSNNESSVRTPVAARADIHLEKTGPSAAVAGETISWELTVGNSGPSLAQAVTVTDTLPASVTFQGATGASCEPTGEHGVMCTVGDLPVGGTATITLTGLIDPDVDPGTADAPTLIVNTASVGSSTPQPVDAQEDDTATFATPVTSRAELAVEKTVSPSPMVAGSPAEYLVTVANAGPSTAKEVTLADTLPEGVTVIAVEGPGECSSQGSSIECALGSIAPGSSAFVIVDVAVDADYRGAISNMATASASNAEDAEGSVEVDVVAHADLILSKAADRPAILAGEAVTYTLTVVNEGPSVATGVITTDVVPPGMQLVALDPACEAVANGAETITCNLGELGVGEIAIATLTLRAPQALTGETVSNTATVTSDVDDPDGSDNNATSLVELGTRADLSVAKSSSVEAVQVGEDFVWTLVVNNHGPSMARDVVLTDQVPAGLEVLTAAVAGVDDPRECTVNGQDIRCELGDVAVGQTAITVTTRVPLDTEMLSVENRAQVESSTPDLADTDNEATSMVGVIHRADLEAGKAASPNPVMAGEQLTYTFTTTNHGPSVAREVVVSDLLPAGLNSPEVVASGGAECAISPPIVDATAETPDNSGLLHCAALTLDVGEVLTITVTAEVDESLVGTVLNTVTVGSAVPDPEVENNEATAEVEVLPAPTDLDGAYSQIETL